MENLLLCSKLKQLPENLKSEVLDFIDFLLSKSKASKKSSSPKSSSPKFGSAKGMIIMKDDFDEPVDDFKEYM